MSERRGEGGRFYLRPRCHRDAPLMAYLRDDGSLSLECSECGRAVLPPVAPEVYAPEPSGEGTNVIMEQ